MKLDELIEYLKYNYLLKPTYQEYKSYSKTKKRGRYSLQGKSQ